MHIKCKTGSFKKLNDTCFFFECIFMWYLSYFPHINNASSKLFGCQKYLPRKILINFSYRAHLVIQSATTSQSIIHMSMYVFVYTPSFTVFKEIIQQHYRNKKNESNSNKEICLESLLPTFSLTVLALSNVYIFCINLFCTNKLNFFLGFWSQTKH